MMIKRFILLFLILISALTQNRVEAEEVLPVGCVKTPFIFQDEPTKMKEFNVNSGKMVVVHKSIAEKDPIDAIGYNEKDGYFWGYNYKKNDGTIVKIGKSDGGKWSSESVTIGELENFRPGMGDIDKNGHLYMKSLDLCTRVVVVDLDPNSDKYLTKIRDFNLSECMRGDDWAFNPEDDLLYSVYNKTLYVVDPKTGKKLSRRPITNKLFEGRYVNDHYERGEITSFANQYFDKNGFLYIHNRLTGNVFRLKPKESTKAVKFSTSEPIFTTSDGASCRDIEFKSDLGDLPDSYHTSLDNDGAKHVMPPYSKPIVYMGDIITSEDDGKPSEKANADDGDDGVTVDGKSMQYKIISYSDNELKIKTHGNGYLNAWIDWDVNGTFDKDEQIAKSINGNSGEITIDVDIPKSAKEKLTFARFRYSSKADLNSTENAEDGEVEDYCITVKKAFKKGVFNIERTDSGSYEINSKERNAWYTQIVGRDFHYSLLFYDEKMKEERTLEKIAIKIELIDQDTNKVLYTKYDYIGKKGTTTCNRTILAEKRVEGSSKGRKDYLDLIDLKSLPATKRAIFKVSYGIGDHGGVIQKVCNTPYNPKACFDALPKTTSAYARDNFAIRPEYFHIIVADKKETLMVNRSPYNKGSIRLTAGYDYNLTVTASAFKGSDDKPSPDYNTTANRLIEFLDKDNPHIVNKSDIKIKDTFKDGRSTIKKLEVQEVGKYRLHILDSDWASVDIEKGDCNKNSSKTSPNGNIRCGCNVASVPDINLTFYPDHFNVDLKLQNLPPSSHDDFLYMSEINATYNEVAISYIGKITAKSEDDITTKNFIKDYMAEDTTVELSGTTKSQEGIDKAITTIKGSPVYFTRVLRFNSDTEVQVDRKQIFNELPTIDVPKAKFLNEQNGSVNIDLRYNVGKHLSEPINPIQIKFNTIDVNSSDAYSLSHGKDESNPHTPTGTQELGSTRNLYASQVAPDKIVCPTVRFSEEDRVRTPLQVEIYCGGGVNYQHCEDTNLTKHISVNNSPRAETGWFLSSDHNSSVDGKVEKLIPDGANPNVLEFTTINTTKNHPFPIVCENGRSGTLTTKFTDLTVDTEYRVDIYTSTPLKFYSGKPKPNIPLGVPHYIVQGVPKSDATSSVDWIGKGKTGHVLDIDSRGSTNSKMEW